jgi:hypothetical protein
MTAKIMAAVVILIFAGALGLGLVGADAAGFGGAPRLPLLNGGTNAIPTDTPAATATPTRTPVPPFSAAQSVELATLPDEIVCDGLHTSAVRVRLSDGNGKPVRDGTPVYFSTLGRPGFTSPPVGLTTNGVAWTHAGAYPAPQSPYQPFSVEVDAGRIQATIRVFCLPEGPPPCETPASPPQVSPPDASSPPQSPPSQVSPPPPPCPTPQSPPTCDGPTSPPQSVSPPCPTATPTPFSPPPCGVTSPPFGTPPCDTPTVTPTATPTVTAVAECTGDVNGDGKVNMSDLLGVMHHMRQRNVDPRYDVNHDGKVDSADMLLVIRNFGKRCR